MVRVFVDASVLVAAALSRSGASYTLFKLGSDGRLALILTQSVVKEARLSIKKKYGKEKLLPFYTLLSGLKETILPVPSPSEIALFTHLITDKKDRHVLAGAQKYRADVLVTLDRRHFFTPQIKNANLPFNLQLPGEFLTEYRQQQTNTPL